MVASVSVGRCAGERPGEERRGLADRAGHAGGAVGAGRLRAAGADRAGRARPQQHAVRAPRRGTRLHRSCLVNHYLIMSIFKYE